MSLPTVNAIWIGPTLGAVHAACLRSFLRHGHKVVLHCYEPPCDVPDGISISDARMLLPDSMIFRDKVRGSFSCLSNLLRYELLAQGHGLYCDCDVFCLRPFEDREYIFGREDNGLINGAVLKLPADSPAVIELRAIKSKGIDTLAALPWGTTGPKAVTVALKRHGLDKLASPIDVFYPVHWSCTELLGDPELRLCDLVTRRTIAVHLVNQGLTALSMHDNVHPESPLGEILAA